MIKFYVYKKFVVKYFKNVVMDKVWAEHTIEMVATVVICITGIKTTYGVCLYTHNS